MWREKRDRSPAAGPGRAKPSDKANEKRRDVDSSNCKIDRGFVWDSTDDWADLNTKRSDPGVFLSCVGSDGYPLTKAVVPGKYRESLKEIYFCTNTSSKFAAAISKNPNPVSIFTVGRLYGSKVVFSKVTEVSQVNNLLFF